MSDTPEATATKPAEESVESPTAAAPEPQPSAAAADAPAAAESSAPPADAGGVVADRPSNRIKLGSSRKEPAPAAGKTAAPKPAPKPVTPVTVKQSAPKPANTPPPNVRVPLTADEEAELEAALAGESLDTLIDTAAAAPPEELAPQTKVTGRVASVGEDFLMVDLGGHRQGALPLKQFDQRGGPAAALSGQQAGQQAGDPEDDPADDPADDQKPAPAFPAAGEEVTVVVVRH
ncbi:MAG: hypothetical protein AAGG46_10030, partial [Planctomycetota bacterium]